MTGARIPVTFPIRLIPPMITIPTIEAVTRPVIQVSIPKLSETCVAMVLDWIALPVKNDVIMSMKAKKMATGFQFQPKTSLIPFSI